VIFSLTFLENTLIKNSIPTIINYMGRWPRLFSF
jgi:hypothetical protein